MASSAVSGSVKFSAISNGAGGYNLQIDITNTATIKPPATADVLTGIYFDVLVGGASPGPLSMKSAVATAGLLDATHQTAPNASTINTSVCSPGGVNSALSPTCATTVAGGWQLDYKSSGIGGGASATHQKYGVGTSGQGGAFDSSGSRAGGVNYGVLPSAGYSSSSLNSNAPYSYHTVTIVLTGLTSNLFQISNVNAAYGDSPSGTPAASLVFEDQPEPETWILMGTGLALIAVSRRRRTLKP